MWLRAEGGGGARVGRTERSGFYPGGLGEPWRFVSSAGGRTGIVASAPAPRCLWVFGARAVVVFVLEGLVGGSPRAVEPLSRQGVPWIPLLLSGLLPCARPYGGCWAAAAGLVPPRGGGQQTGGAKTAQGWAQPQLGAVLGQGEATGGPRELHLLPPSPV